MTLEILIVLLVLAATFGLLLRERHPPDLVAMLAFATLLVTGVLAPREAFQVFGHEAVITVASMFVISAGLEHAGVIGAIARLLNSVSGRSDFAVLLVTLPVVALLSAFVNNTPVVVVFIPVMFSLARERGLKPSRLLIPLSFASICGGTCTLIGTSTNVIVSSEAESLGLAPLNMFELSRVGVFIVAAGLVYLLLFTRWLLPDRETFSSLLPPDKQRQYLTEVVVVADSSLIGRKLGDTPLKKLKEGRVLEVIRLGDSMPHPLTEVTLQAGDRMRFSTNLASVMEIKSIEGLKILPEEGLGLALVGAQQAMVMECIVGPNSSFIGRTIRELDLRRRFGVLVLAVHRQGVNRREDIAEMRLQYGDTLLVEGPEAVVGRLRDSNEFLLLVDVPPSVTRPRRAWLAAGITALVVGLAALNVYPIAVVAMLGAALMLFTRCLEVDEAYRSVNWQTLFLICGMLTIGLAMEKTKATEFLAGAATNVFQVGGPKVMLSLLLLATSVLTQFLTNNAVAALLTPVAIQTALTLGVDPRPFVIAVAVGASSCFASPIGYQTNTLVYSAGGYKFSDFLRAGIPLNLIVWLLGSLLIPVFWPL